MTQNAAKATEQPWQEVSWDGATYRLNDAHYEMLRCACGNYVELYGPREYACECGRTYRMDVTVVVREYTQ